MRSSVTLQTALGTSEGFGDDARLGDWALDGLTLVRGLPNEAGVFPAIVTAQDARGVRTSRVLSIIVSDPLFSLAHLLKPLLDRNGAPLPKLENDFLDNAGNGNGRYDVGDLRAWIIAKQPT
ncbi:MAG: hypothetical protein ABIT38_17420 [Gemmatimonadaceae bacterium]